MENHTRLFLVRHGETDHNAQGRFQGHTDIPLNNTGREQASLLRDRLSELDFDVVVSSDLSRAWETAQILTKGRSQNVQPEVRLREANFGVWEGLTFAEIAETYPEEWQAWEAHTMHTAPHGGESMTDFAGRVEAAYRSITEDIRGKTLLVVAHGGVLKMTVCLAMGLPPQAHWQFKFAPTSLTEIYAYSQGAIVSTLNDTCHLGERQWES